jgi:hypothetical protein
MINGDIFGAINGKIEWQGKQKYSQKTCPLPAMLNTDPTYVESGLKPG